jgi:hypothetical protein
VQSCHMEMLIGGHSVKRNQNSPLLCLPPEIRNRIWEFALCGNDIRQVNCGRRSNVFLPKPSERLNTFALLRVCRQIYAETALLPFSGNTFSVVACRKMGNPAKAFKKYQCSQITHLQVELWDSAVRVSPRWFVSLLSLKNFAFLPGLRCIKVQLFPDKDWEFMSFSKTKTLLRLIPEYALLADKYDLVVEKMDVSWVTFYRE